MDTGLFQRMLGLNISTLLDSTDWEVVNKGSLAELYAGLELVKSSNPYEQTLLYYWLREVRNSNAKVDYLVQQSDKICPLYALGNKMRSLFRKTLASTVK